MKNIFYKIGILSFVLLIAAGCDYEEQFDPNNPSLGSDASVSALQGMVTGLEARHRQYFGSATQMFGSFGREVWAFFGSDPRFINDWLGVSGTTYPDFFASNGTYLSPYQAVKQANALISSAEGSTTVSPAQLSGYKGFANTIKAYQLIWPLMQQWDNGIRVEINDPLDPGPILSRTEALAAIRGILDVGYNDLQGAGSDFAFTLTTGWAGFDTPATMAQLNRGIAARLAVYAGDYAGARTALGQSFLNMNDARSASAMMVGPAHVYGEAPDINNPFYYPLDANTSTILIVHTALVEDNLAAYGGTADNAGGFVDERANRKFWVRADPVINAAMGAGNPGQYQDRRWSTNTAPAPFIRNEELILLAAEAEWNGGSKTEAIRAINNVRNTWGVGDSPVTDTSSPAEFEDELLFQRRYSLWAEGGHRWFDLRRMDRLNATDIDLRDGGTIFTQVAPRSSETNWENAN